MTPHLVRCDPPVVDRARRRDRQLTEWHSLLTSATKNKNKWYRVEPAYESSTQASSTAYDIRTGRNGALPDGRWDACARENYLYVKFLGK